MRYEQHKSGKLCPERRTAQMSKIPFIVSQRYVPTPRPGWHNSSPLHTETCNPACIENIHPTPKIDKSDLLYGSKSPAEKVGVDAHVTAR